MLDLQREMRNYEKKMYIISISNIYTCTSQCNESNEINVVGILGKIP